MIKKIKTFGRIVKNKPKGLIYALGDKRVFNWLPDKYYLKLLYWGETGKKLNLVNPQTYNEKLQWLKLYNRKPEYTKYVDKYAVRSYIAEIIGDEYLIPLIGVYNSIDEIDWNSLPEKFVLKCTHGSSANIICTNKKELNIKDVKGKLNKWMKKNWYWFGREWPYKQVRPRIICEKFIEQNDGDELRDYRFFCFNGEPKFITVDFSITNKKKTRRNLYDLEWNLMDEEISYPKELGIKVKKPEKLCEMINLSKKLSANIPHLRVDFYYIKEKIIFGEMTFFHQSGMGQIRPTKFDNQIGEWLKLPKTD
ncbi:ATP-grasp fold amidoligase family protein [Pseudogracilibacillus auburnensis]|uniref:Teichuronopeptide biosynthesis TupA-like protein n=1 Tax=Pseudogracilibacillus auburnensis TaxID=1494959 RepID=A0A2V3WB39_9BACI|nr:ATP-grasp fold amidoligase family protein [Pseudogracilibacillus auburnensis]PXW85959.1 teichuronopeptide biosynthesis TupA-like protein [Pseudogracilibacillus auburnensis]